MSMPRGRLGALQCLSLHPHPPRLPLQGSEEAGCLHQSLRCPPQNHSFLQWYCPLASSVLGTPTSCKQRFHRPGLYHQGIHATEPTPGDNLGQPASIETDLEVQLKSWDFSRCQVAIQCHRNYVSEAFTKIQMGIYENTHTQRSWSFKVFDF